MGMPDSGGKSSLRAIGTDVFDGVMSITVGKDFDSGNVHQDWAQQVQVMRPGPFGKVVIDCSACGLLSSTFFAGIMQLHMFYTGQGIPPIVLDRPDPRIVKNLQLLRLHTYFTIIPR